MKFTSDSVQKKTSETHPLMFDTLDIGRGSVGMTICPGKKGPSLYGPPWDRNLELDLKSIEEFGATRLVTLMRSKELLELGVPLVDFERSTRCKHYFVPVHDLNGPKFDPYNDNIFWSWQNTLDRLTRLLSHGERVVVHCRGGLGRTGTFVAELLMRHGYNSVKAIKTVRAARPGAIETRAQLDYLLNHAELHSEPYAKRA